MGAAWVGFDLDGTLAKSSHDYGANPHAVGEPIPKMVGIAKSFIESGYRVKIFTARVGPHGDTYPDGRLIDPEFIPKARKAIEDWCLEHLGQVIEVTCEKDYGMLFCFDDRAVSIEENEGNIIADMSRMPCCNATVGA